LTARFVLVDFDTQIFSAQEFGGISRYFARIALSMHEQGQAAARIVAPLHINAYLDRLPADLVAGRRIRRPRRAASLVRAASMALAAPVHCLRGPDILHETYYSPLALPSRARRRVVTVYDMIHEKFPQDFSPRDPIRRWKLAAVKRADHVICISEQTRRDLLSMCDLPAERVSVTYLGYDSLGDLVGETDASAFRTAVLGVDQPYILYVGQRGGYKNFAGLLGAYAASPFLRQNFRILCFGGGGLIHSDRQLIASHGVEGRVVHLGGGDEVLAACYRHAALFVYPSLYEGFGIPPLEAMSLDCPVACSNTSSLPEVVGDAAALFDPADAVAMREALESVLNTPQARTSLVERGRLRREMFSWRRCAAETAHIYRRLLDLSEKCA
jgi:glycosyltransferase involved in cell wall biosynthesis